jgi:hypothetical protein
MAAIRGFGSVLRAQPVASITVFSPSGSASDVVPEGEDYFTLVFGDPRDVDQRLDLRYQHRNVTDISVENGLWAANGGSYVYPLWPGMGGAANIGQTGQDFPFDGDRFTQFSLRAQTDAGRNIKLTYFTGPHTGPGEAAQPWLPGDKQMHTLLWEDISWPSSIAGLRLGISGDPFIVDWVRLTDPTASPEYTISWTADNVNWVNIYCDADMDVANGFDHLVKAGVNARAGSYDWKTGYLAPGSYYVYIEDADSPGTYAYGPGPLTIKPAPIVDITAPSRTSGDDYATEEMGNPWDMSDSADIALERHLDSVSFTGGTMHATTTGADPYIHLRSAGDDTIETGYYKYLTWRFYVEGDWANSPKRLGGDPNDRWGVSRLYADAEGSWSTYNDVIPWEGWHVYQMDLSRGGGKYYLDNTASSDPGWNGLASTIRLDLLEPYSHDRWPIHLDYVLLTADPRPAGDGTYKIEWEVLQGEPITTTLYYVTNPSTSCEQGTFIGQIAPVEFEPQPPPGPYRVYLPLVMAEAVGPGEYLWDVLSPRPVPPGEYYVKVLADDGFNRTCWTSDAPLVIDP